MTGWSDCCLLICALNPLIGMSIDCTQISHIPSITVTVFQVSICFQYVENVCVWIELKTSQQNVSSCFCTRLNKQFNNIQVTLLRCHPKRCCSSVSSSLVEVCTSFNQ